MRMGSAQRASACIIIWMETESTRMRECERVCVLCDRWRVIKEKIVFDCARNKSTKMYSSKRIVCWLFVKKMLTCDWMSWTEQLCVARCVGGWALTIARVRTTSHTYLLACLLFMTVVIKYCSLERFLPFLSFIRMNEICLALILSLLNIWAHPPNAALRQVTRYIYSFDIHKWYTST